MENQLKIIRINKGEYGEVKDNIYETPYIKIIYSGKETIITTSGEGTGSGGGVELPDDLWD